MAAGCCLMEALGSRAATPTTPPTRGRSRARARRIVPWGVVLSP